MLLLQLRRPLQDGLSVVLGSSEEPKSPQTQAGAGGGTQHGEQASAELPTKTVKAVVQVKNAIEAENRNPLEINFEKAAPAAEAINKVKQDLATKEIEQRLKQEIER